MKKIAILGLGRFGKTIAGELYNLGAEVIAIERDRETIDKIQNDVTLAVAADVRNQDVLEQHGVRDVDVVVVGIGEDFESNVLVTSIASEMGVPEIITRSYNDQQRRILRRVGATRVLSPEEDIAKRLAKSLVTAEIVDFLELPEGFVVKQFPLPERYAGKTLAEAQIRGKYLIDIVVIKRKVVDDETKEVTTASIAIPGGDVVLEKGDVLGIVGKEQDIDKFGS